MRSTLGFLILLAFGVMAVAILFAMQTRSPMAAQVPDVPEPLSTGETANATPTVARFALPESGVSTGTIPVTVLPLATPSTFDHLDTPNAAQVASQQRATEMNYAFYEQPGTVIAEGTNKTPVKGTKYNTLLTSYRITEVVLRAPVTWDVNAPLRTTRKMAQQALTIDRLWRIEIFGDVPIGSLDWYIFIDQQLAAPAGYSDNGLIGVMFDDDLLREGASLGVENGGTRGDRLEELPETLHLLNR